MTLFRLILTGVAALNFRKAKAEYNALKEQYDGLTAAINTLSDQVDKYNENKYNALEEIIDEKPNDFAPGLKVTTILRVANLVGKFFLAKISIVFQNTSETPYYITKALAQCSVEGMPLIINEKLHIDNFNLFDPSTLPGEIDYTIPVNSWINPGEIREFGGTAGRCVLVNTETGEVATGRLREIICEKAGKKLITSCPKISIEDAQKADLEYYWCKTDSEKALHGYYVGKPGALRYCGEAGLK